MKQETLRAVRKYLGMSQRELAANLGISLKAIQSYEQGWRRIPAILEKQVLFYISRLNRKSYPDIKDCWEIRKCDEETRAACIAGELGAGKECWFVSGNICRGSTLKNWEEKRKICFKCEVFLQHMQILKGKPLHKKLLNTS